MTFNIVVRRNPAYNVRVLPRIIPPTSGGAIVSVNGQFGPTVLLDADDISDTSTTAKFTTTAEKANWNTAFGWGNHASAGYALSSGLATVATTGAYSDLSGTPTLGTAAASDTGDFATAGQGSLADSAVQPGDLATVATSGDYDHLTNKPTLGALAAKDEAAVGDIDATGTPSASTYLRGDGTWATPAGSGDMVFATDVIDDDTFATASAATVPTSESVKAYVDANVGGGSGTVTSVDMSVPTGLQVSGNPITTSGTFAITFASGYSIPTTAKQGEWDTAYGWGNHASAGYLDSGDIGVTVQGYSANLAEWSGINPSANGGSLVSAADYAAMRGLLDLEAGTDFLSPAAIAAAYQPLDGDLTSWAGVTRASGFDTFTATPSSANLKSLLTDETGSGALVFATSPAITTPALTDPAITGAITEDIYTITDGAAFEIDPSNGSIQRVTLGASRTPKATNFANGESMTLEVDDGSLFTLTWTDATFGGSGVLWVGGLAPTLATSGWTVIELWKIAGQVYGASPGSHT